MGDEETQCLARKRRPWVSRDVTAFELLEQIGEGTYGEVWKARDRGTGEEVALKKVRMGQEREGFPLTAIREIKLLKTLRHENVICLKEIVMGGRDDESKRGKDSIFMVFEYMDHDLFGLMDTPTIKFRPDQIKCYMHQLLTGLAYCHSREVLHRDIKGSNLLISNKGKLKLADFGLARFCVENSAKYTNRVITLWYRPPELLLGDDTYGKAVDVWSCGCILAELLTRRPLLAGKNEVDQIDLIFGMFGRPNEKIWPGCKSLPMFDRIQWDRYPDKSRFREKYERQVSAEALLLLELMLNLDPAKRCSAKAALEADWFKTPPLACEPLDLPSYESVHEFQAKKKKQEAAEQKARQPNEAKSWESRRNDRGFASRPYRGDGRGGGYRGSDQAGGHASAEFPGEVHDGNWRGGRYGHQGRHHAPSQSRGGGQFQKPYRR
mmetsp:Transcript_3689/g.7057  ORF Transcript_3689/g.7057 Transcript_3689/m.7057 type:complete len:437 (-) Transcript_3689:487-1797(-)